MFSFSRLVALLQTPLLWVRVIGLVIGVLAGLGYIAEDSVAPEDIESAAILVVAVLAFLFNLVPGLLDE